MGRSRRDRVLEAWREGGGRRGKEEEEERV